MARRKTTKRKTTTTAKKRRSPARRRTTRKKSAGFANFFVPMFFICCILICLGFLLFMGYQTVTASSFFDIEREKVEVQGVTNISKDKIKKIVAAQTVQDGVWHTDTNAIKDEIEKFEYTKKVSVSRVLPNSIRVIVQERKPVALVRLNGTDYWFDIDARKLKRAEVDEDRPPFTMFGWDEEFSSEADEQNVKRIKLYLALLEEWESYKLADRVKAVDLSDLRDPQAIVEDSGYTVRILLDHEDSGKKLQKGIEQIAGRGKEINSIDMSGVNPVLSYRNS